MSFEQNISAISALEVQQHGIIQNLACISQNGFRKTNVSIEGKSDKQKVFRLNSTNPIEKPNAQVSVSLEQGQLLNTSNETDFAIKGEGFFKLEDNNGRALLTRDGSFHFNNENILVNSEGFSIQGEDGPIQRDNKGAKIVVHKDGAVFEGNKKIGKLSAYKFPESTEASGSSTFVLNDDQVAEISEESKFEQGFLEESNASSVQEMVSLINVKNLYESNINAIKQYHSHLAKATEILGEQR